MDIREFLQIDSSRLNAEILVDKIEEDPEVFETVWEIMLEDTYPLSMRASRVIWLFAIKHPYYLEPRLPEIISILPGIKTESVWRNLLNMISLLSIPSAHTGSLFNLCYGLVESPTTAIAVKANAMTILYNISNIEPELKIELITLFESQRDTESAAIFARSEILLKKLYKEVK
ncbi:MAG: hypothetical protein AMS26_14165 [Bacteroides sp. SM23_62]|nr:MAG: hypothetical protein AMS26_14165 [Bacteroides sp. SM23_62]